jgi:hypothetical protein
MMDSLPCTAKRGGQQQTIELPRRSPTAENAPMLRTGRDMVKMLRQPGHAAECS